MGNEPAAPPARPPLTVLPRLGPLPTGWAWLLLPLLLSAVLLLAPASLSPATYVPGDAHPDLPGISHTFWLLPQVGLDGWAHARMVGYPTVSDYQTMLGVPFDALLAWPLLATLGYPAGFTVFQVLCLWALGGTGAWLGGRWWRSLAGALVTGVALQSASVIVREVLEGRHTHMTGAIFVPLALGWYCHALVEGRARHAFAAGVAVGFAALTFWYWGLWAALALLVFFLLALLERRNPLPSLAWGAAGSLAVAGFSMTYTILHAGGQPGTEVGPWSVLEGEYDPPIVLVSLLETRDVFHLGAMTSVLLFRPLYLGLVALVLWRQARRRWLAPVLQVGVGFLLATGPLWALDDEHLLLSPAYLLNLLPLLRRFWWPDRYLLVGAVGAAILAGGGAAVLEDLLRRRWGARAGLAALGLAGLLLAEAFLVSPHLPLPATEGAPSPRAKALAKGTSPVLLLPTGPLLGSAPGWNHDFLLDQVHHRRPTVNGLMPPEAAMAPHAYRELWTSPGLQSLRNCEPDPTARPEPGSQADLDALVRSGVRDAWVSAAQVGGGKRRNDYLRCVARLLGVNAKNEGPFVVFTLSLGGGAGLADPDQDPALPPGVLAPEVGTGATGMLQGGQAPGP